MLLIYRGTISSAESLDSSLMMYLDGSSITTQDDAFSYWLDKSGNGNTFEQDASPKTSPTVIADELNGQDVLSFNGSTDQLRIPAARAADLNPGSSEFEIIMVVQIKAANSGEYLLRKGNYSSSADQGWSIYLDATGRLISRLNTEDIDDDDHKAGRTHFLNTAGDLSKWIIYDVWADTNSVDPNFRDLLVDVSGRGVSVDGQIWNGGKFIGLLNPVDTAYLGIGTEMEIAELRFYSRALSEEEREQLGSYLTTKYALDTAYSAMDDCEYLWYEGQGNIADFNHDCAVNMLDFAGLASVWLTDYSAQ